MGNIEGMRVALASAINPVGGALAAASIMVVRAFLILLVFSAGAHAADPLRAREFKMAGDATHMRVVMQFDVEPDIKWTMLRGPHRLAIDLPETRFGFLPADLKPKGLIRDVRYGMLGAGTSRVILSTKGPFTIDNATVVQ